jgi:aryl-alcohol dehydrogenase-like predicted oxidoreductase
MIYKKVFQTDKNISCIGIGALHFGTFTNEENARLIIDFAIEEGVNYFDTAPMYGNSNSEKILGSILKKNRKKVMIGSKIGLRTIGSGKNSKAESIKLNKENIELSINNTLKSLQTDYIDYYQLHYFDNSTPLIETLQALKKEKEKGKILNIGVCNYEKANLLELFNLKNISNIVAGLHCHYNIIERRLEKELLNIVSEKKISLLCFQVFARGFLTGKYSYNQKIQENTRAFNSRRFDRFFKKEMFDSINKIQTILNKYECSLKEAALTWLVNKDYVTCGVVGFRNLEQTKEILNILKKKIDLKMIEEIDNLINADSLLSNYIYNFPNPFMEY